MRWVDASRDHAEVVECGPLGDRPDVHLVADPVGEELLPAPVDLHVEVAVPVAPHRAGPQPAIGLVANLAAEPLANVAGLGALCHGPKHTTTYTEWIGAQLLDHLTQARAL